MASVAMLALAACSSGYEHRVANSYPSDVREIAEGADDSFEVASATTDSALSHMRGGFVGIGGLTIDFGLISSTTVNNTLVSNLSLSSSGLTGSVPSNIQQIIQTGTGNQAGTTSAVPSNVLTIVQNTTNNSVIQNTNILNITVGNLAAFRNQQAGLSQRFLGGLAR